MNIQSGLFIACTIMLCIASCKKKDEENKNIPQTPSGNRCQLMSIIRHQNGCKDSTVISGSMTGKMSGYLRYDNCRGGAPGQTTISGETYIYDGNKVYVIDTSAMANRDTLILDASLRRIQEARRYSPMAGGHMSTRYEYAQDGTLLRSISSYNSVPYDTASYTYSNGDMVMQVNNLMGHQDTFRFRYYTDRPIPAGSYISQHGLRYGVAFTYKNAHLLMGIMDGQGNLLDQYSYETGDFGNITRVVRTDTKNPLPADTTTYRYACVVE